MITTSEALKECCDELIDSPFLALDTEFLREKTYFPKLALIQIANESSTYVIDPLAIDKLDDFFTLVNNPEITKVLHSARQDYEIFFNLQGHLPKPIFDTQVAASLLGYGEQIGYANLIKNLLDIDVDKSQTRTDWTKRPLNNKQLDYAASDVIHLAKVYPMMLKRLEELNRTNWLDDDFEQLTNASTFQADKRSMWKKIKSANRLPAKKLSIVQELADWRESQAIAQDRPRKHVLSDDSIVDIANQQPDSVAGIREIRQINPRLKEAEVKQLLNCVQIGLNKPESDWPKFDRKHKPSMEQSAIVDLLSVIVQIRAAENQISPAFICNKKDLVKIVCGDSDSPLYKGWRKQLVGESIKQFLFGNSNIHLKGNKLMLD